MGYTINPYRVEREKKKALRLRQKLLNRACIDRESPLIKIMCEKITCPFCYGPVEFLFLESCSDRKVDHALRDFKRIRFLCASCSVEFYSESFPTKFSCFSSDGTLINGSIGQLLLLLS